MKSGRGPEARCYGNERVYNTYNAINEISGKRDSDSGSQSSWPHSLVLRLLGIGKHWLLGQAHLYRIFVSQ